MKEVCAGRQYQMIRMSIHKTRTLHAATLAMLRTFMAVMDEVLNRKRTGSRTSKDHYRQITGILRDVLTQCYSLTNHLIPLLNPTSLLREVIGVVHKQGNSK